MLTFIIDIFILLTIVDAISSFIPELNRNEYMRKIRRVVEIPQRPIRNLLPPNLPFDLAPIIVIALLRLIVEMI